MKNDLISLRDQLRTSYWFIPAGMALVTVKADEQWGRL